MITQIKSRLFLLLLVLTCAGSALADTTFKITDGVVESQLKDRMEANTKALLDAFRKAADDGEKTVKLSKDNVSKTAIEEIREIWKSSALSCPPMSIRCRCLQTKDGYQVRGIPVDMLEADEADARQELTVNYDHKTSDYSRLHRELPHSIQPQGQCDAQQRVQRQGAHHHRTRGEREAEQRHD